MDRQIDIILQGGQFKKLLEEQSAELRQKYDMKRAELEILYFLSKSGEHNTSTDIHRQLMMNRGHISQAVDNLCRRNYIIAIPDKNDRRYVHYEISDHAKELITEMTSRREAMNQKILEGVSEEELKIYREVSEKIRNNINKLIF
ncbi:MarR family winged helix-turn-helix transcriptional regulator [Sporofaciens sp. SGI.106]|uniref:MarR family winged helix-turn-helix transcriptional regulator n=1 Tax=Sporofaciens sp. SGI.106 TaxID=3420568 RepID=UPI002A9D31BA|nr:MarR family winged helix-turn-helix transcriptional regulator [Lachnoclostridium sp.]